jgi:hypothetical protein
VTATLARIPSARERLQPGQADAARHDYPEAHHTGPQASRAFKRRDPWDARVNSEMTRDGAPPLHDRRGGALALL